MGLSISENQLDQFLLFLGLLKKWNTHINLTALQSDQDIIVKHFLDSLSPIPYLPQEAHILDLGSGAGFPGIPIKIYRPSQPVTLLEASAKKISFLKEAVRSLNLEHILVCRGFLGKGAPSPVGDNRFEIIITRAVGNLGMILKEAGARLIKEGRLILMKGPQGHQELSDLESAIDKAGFQLESPLEIILPFSESKRTIFILRKV